ncbi:MAG: hypothetical protein HC862_06575 [Scytonema sp. RU_4_4]|nr:hypothetical protein [Scytonema sp. RU_4_4]NJR74894.1 hypothetical protein [Scytonema sp. CRU_2_7]
MLDYLSISVSFTADRLNSGSIVSKKNVLNYLQLDFVKQAGAAVKFQLQQEIKQTETDRNEVAQKIKQLENSL